MLSSVFTLALGVLTTYVVGSLAYNAFIHPLSKFPGPRLWGASRFPFVVSMVSGRLPHDYRRLHEEYGPVVRVAPDELSFIDAAAWRDIYTKPHFIRPWQWRGKPPGVPADNLISATEKDHARFRRILGPAFSEQAMQRQEPIIQQYVDLFIEKLKEKAAAASPSGGAVVDLVEWFNYTTFDIIGDLGWGSPFDCLKSQTISGWIQVVLHFQAVVIATSFKYLPPLDSIIDAITPAAALKDINMVIETARQKVSERLSTTTDRPDMMSFVQTQGPKGVETMNQGELELNSFAVIVAGSESVTTILTGIVNNLLSAPEAYGKLVKEIRAAFTNEADITGASAARLTYLNAVLKEGMRTTPSIPDGSRRDIPKGEVATIAGHAVPGPATVAVPQWSAYTAASNFTNAQLFAPERWLPEGQALYASDSKGVFQPFGVGSHNCMGQPLAWHEMRLILARLLFSFDLSLPETASAPLVWSTQAIYWTWVKEPLQVKIVRR